MPTITYTPSCHVVNMTEFANQTPIVKSFDVESINPSMNYRENVVTTLDDTDCATQIGKSLSFDFTIPYIDSCDMPGWLELISSSKCGNGIQVNFCDVASISALRPEGKARIVGNPNWSEVGAHAHSLKLKIKMSNWNCF